MNSDQAIDRARKKLTAHRTMTGFVRRHGSGYRVDRRQKLSSIVPNEVILHLMQKFFAERFGERKGGRLLDLGAGLKPYAVVYEQYFRECVSVDHAHSPHAIDVDIIASADALPIANAQFDCVLCTEVLEHCADPDAVLSEMARVLKPGGYVFLTTPFLVSLHEMPYDFYRYTPSALRLMAEEAGFDVESIETKGDYFAVLIAMLQYPFAKAWQALSKRLRLSLFDPRNPLVLVTILWPQLLYLVYWRAARRWPMGLLGRMNRKLDYITLGYVTVLRRL